MPRPEDYPHHPLSIVCQYLQYEVDKLKKQLEEAESQKDKAIAACKMLHMDGSPEVTFEEFFKFLESHGKTQEESGVEFMHRFCKNAVGIEIIPKHQQHEINEDRID